MLPTSSSELIPVATATNPFDPARTYAWAEEGKTVAEIILEQGVSLDGAYGVLVTIGGELVPEHMLAHVRPKAGSQVYVRVVPRGGDSGKFIFGIIIGILSFGAGFATMPAWTMAGLLSAEGAMAAALMIGGTMGVVNGIQSLVAPPPQVPFSGDIPTSQDSAALTGTKNTSRLYGPVRTVLGKYRVYPDVLAKPFAERVGKDSVLRVLFCFGYGPLLIEDVRIGEQPITDLIDASKYNVLQGWDDDPDLSIFRDDVVMDTSLQPELQRLNPEQPLDATWEPSSVLVTKQDPKEISIDFQFAGGLIAFSDNGDPVDVSVTFTIEEREQGTPTFNPISTPTHGLDEDSGFIEDSAGTFTLKLAERGTVTRGLRWTAPSYADGAVHEIQITRTDTTTTVTKADRIISDAKVLIIRTIKPHTKSLIPNLAKIELEINASDTGLSGIIDNLSAVCTSILPKWDNATKLWGPTHANASAYGVTMYATQNAAWHYANVLRGPSNTRPIPDSRIDGPALLSWSANLDGTSGSDDLAISGTQNVPRNLDAVVDYTTTVRKVLSDIAGAGRASVSIADGKYSVVQDVPQTDVVQHFSPRNSSGFSGAKTFRRKPHAIRTHFVNPLKEYQRDERIVYSDGYSLDGAEGTTAATVFSELSLWGVSDAEQAYRDARYHMASNQLRPEVFTITVDAEHIVCNRGDKVRVSHDVMGVGYGGARIKVANMAGSYLLSGEFDEEFHYQPGKDYGMRIRKRDGIELVYPLTNFGKTTSEFELQTTNNSGVNAAVGDLVLFGERDVESLECIVLRISPRNDLSAVIELTEYNAAVYDPGPIPDHVSNISLQNMPTLLKPIKPEIIGSPVSDETALMFSASGTPQPMIVVNVATPAHAEGIYSPTTHYHGQFRMKRGGTAVTDWTNAPRVEATGDTRITLGPVEEGQLYDIRVRAISDITATASDWVSSSDHLVAGMSSPPDAPTDLSIWGDAVRWTYGTTPNDFAGFIVKYQPGTDATWETGHPLGVNLVTENWVQLGGRISPGLTTLMVRAVDLSGNESATLSAVKNIRNPEDWPLLNESVWTNVWAGTKANCTHNVGTTFLEADVDSSNLFWDSGASSAFWGSSSADMWGAVTYKTMSYFDLATIYNDGYVAGWPATDQLPGRMRVDGVETEGSQVAVDYRHVLTADWEGFSLVYTYSEWKPWPGVRELEGLEQPIVFAGTELDYEIAAIRFTIQGGAVQGKLKAGRLLTEASPRVHRVTNASISASGTQISLSGLKWRGVTNVVVTPTTTGSAQGALFGEAYDVEDSQTTTAPYEMNGPTVILYNSAGTATAGTATVVVEGY